MKKANSLNKSTNAICHFIDTPPFGETERRVLPLSGIPFVVKDNILTKGIPTTAGSKILENWRPNHDAEVVKRLKMAGGVLIGKTNMDEFALGFTGTNELHGQTHSRWSPTLIPGGSSAGSAVAVSEGMCSFAIGTDTGGSIRIPCSINGIFGLRPSWGRVPTDGLLPLSPSRDVIGPMARSASDLSRIFSVISSNQSHNSLHTFSKQKKYHFTVINNYISTADREIRLSLESFLQQIRKKAYTTEVKHMNFLPEIGQLSRRIFWSEFENSLLTICKRADLDLSISKLYATSSDRLRDYLDRKPSRVSTFSKDEQIALREKVHSFMANSDFLILPAQGKVAPNEIFISKKTPINHRWFAEHFLQYGEISSVTGIPAIVVPGPLVRGKFPNGIQILGRYREDEKLLAFATHFFENS